MAKGEIACFEQFLHLSQCFQKSSAADASESVYKWERVKEQFSPEIKLCLDLENKQKYNYKLQAISYALLCRRITLNHLPHKYAF